MITLMSGFFFKIRVLRGLSQKLKKKSLVQEVRQMSDISDRRNKG